MTDINSATPGLNGPAAPTSLDFEQCEPVFLIPAINTRVKQKGVGFGQRLPLCDTAQRYLGGIVSPGWYSVRRGYGFIVPHVPIAGAMDPEGKIFVSYKDCPLFPRSAGRTQRKNRGLRAGDLVEFSVGANDRGPVAVEVRLVGTVRPSENTY